MDKQFLFFSISFSIAIVLGMLDYETKSLWHLFSLENLPAIIIFTTVFWMVINAIYLPVQAISKMVGRSNDDVTPGF